MEIYEERGARWAAEARPVRRNDATAFARRVGTGARVDLGCGAGRYTGDLGRPVIGLDAARSMLGLCRGADPGAALVQGDLEALPFGTGTLQGAWANMSYLHLRRVQLPMALADLHRAMAVGAPLDLQVLGGEFEGTGLPEDRIGGRFFAAWRDQALADVVVGAGFGVESVTTVIGSPPADHVVRASAVRLRTLPDTVGAGMRMLVCGLNPSIYAADAGMGFARPGNRFWPAALDAGLVTRPHDAHHALVAHGVGMTDLVKRATPNAAAVGIEEYRLGLARVERLTAWLRPGVVCFVGLAGWRAAADRGAVAGPQPTGLAGTPVYVMPSTSGANARATPSALTAHLEAAMTLGAP